MAPKGKRPTKKKETSVQLPGGSLQTRFAVEGVSYFFYFLFMANNWYFNQLGLLMVDILYHVYSIL